MAIQQTLNVVSFFKGLSENMLELFLKHKGLELDIETLKGEEGQQYWEDSVDEDKRNECRLDLNFPAFHPLKSLQNLTLR